MVASPCGSCCRGKVVECYGCGGLLRQLDMGPEKGLRCIADVGSCRHGDDPPTRWVFLIRNGLSTTRRTACNNLIILLMMCRPLAGDATNLGLWCYLQLVGSKDLTISFSSVLLEVEL
ncbi:unnamed protein product [Urochloa humidicola]